MAAKESHGLLMNGERNLRRCVAVLFGAGKDFICLCTYSHTCTHAHMHTQRGEGGREEEEERERGKIGMVY